MDNKNVIYMLDFLRINPRQAASRYQLMNRCWDDENRRYRWDMDVTKGVETVSDDHDPELTRKVEES